MIIMVELKTLKEITPANDFDRNKFSVRNGHEKLYSESDLREFIIKWIKQIDKSIYNDPRLRDKCPYCGYNMNEKNNSQKVAQKFILKGIFNITEDDLRAAAMFPVKQEVKEKNKKG